MNTLIKIIMLLGIFVTIGCQEEEQVTQRGATFRDDSVVDVTIPDTPSTVESEADEIFKLSPKEDQVGYVPATGRDQSYVSFDSKQGCDNSGVYTAKVNIDPKVPNSNYYNFHYQKIVQDPKLPTYIFIQGGPGGDGIVALEHYKEVFPGNLILLDPRGLGCNAYNGAFSDFLPQMSSINYAHDIIEVIKKEKLNHYIIVGSSYGTKVATMLAHFIEKYDMVPPSSVLLSGTMGTPDFTTRGYYSFFYQIWNVITYIPGFNLLTNASKKLDSKSRTSS